MDEKNKDERSLLLFFEAYIVDEFGKFPSVCMNTIDFEIAERWKKEGLIDFGRLKTNEFVNKHGKHQLTHWIQFSNKAWELSHKLRRERAERHVKTLS